MVNKANLANSVLFAPLSDSDTELEVYTGDGALFPAAPFYLTISPKNKWSRKINSEIVLVTAKATDTFTITRAQKGTTAKAFDDGDLVANGIYKEDLDDIETAYTAAIASAISAAKQALMPVGTIVVLGVSTNPATLYGFGTWTAIEGRVLVGKAASGTFSTLDATGGAESVTLTTAQIPAHQHSMGHVNHAAGPGPANPSADWAGYLHPSWSGKNGLPDWVDNGDGGYPSTGPRGGSGAHNNLQPYIVKYMWQRTA